MQSVQEGWCDDQVGFKSQIIWFQFVAALLLAKLSHLKTVEHESIWRVCAVPQIIQQVSDPPAQGQLLKESVQTPN